MVALMVALTESNGVALKKREAIWQQYCQFREKFSQDVEWEKVGWKPVPRIDGTGLSSWDLIEKTYSCDKKVFSGKNDSPFVIINQALITSVLF